jgi:hypothetical protein
MSQRSSLGTKEEHMKADHQSVGFFDSPEDQAFRRRHSDILQNQFISRLLSILGLTK